MPMMMEAAGPRKIGEILGQPMPAVAPEAATQTTPLEMAIEELGLSTRTLNALYNNDVKKVKDIVKMTEQELADLQGLGGKALAEITKALKKIGMSLAGGLGGKPTAATEAEAKTE